MRRPRVTITLNKIILQQLDKLIDGKQIRNRSHAVEYILSKHFQSTVKKAVILAGGKGAQLPPNAYKIPKSLLPIKGKPVLEYLIENLKKSNIEEIIICIGYLGSKIKQYFGTGEKFGVKISYSEESDALQTGGAMLKIKNKLEKETFVVIYGDVLIELYLKDIITFHKEQNSIATIALTTVGKPTEFGQLQLHGTKLVNFYQKKGESSIKSYLVNCGIYVLKPEIFNYFPKNKKIFMLEDIIEVLIKEEKVNGFVFEGKWFDVGNPTNYEKAIKEFHPLNQK